LNLSSIFGYLIILGGSLKKIAKKITINVPINKNVYTSASICVRLLYLFDFLK